jgi:hypothetical protein
MSAISASKTSSLGYLWNLLHKPETTPTKIPRVDFEDDLIEADTYLDAISEEYADYLAINFQRMIVNKRAIRENKDNIIIYNTGEQTMITFDLDIATLGHCVETSLGLQTHNRCNYKRIINHRVMYGKYNGLTFSEMLTLKLKEVLNRVSDYFQNQLANEMMGTDVFRVFSEVNISGDMALIQANLVPKKL